MGYTKIHAIKATVNKAVDYICNPAKTDASILISAYGCSPETAAYDFKFALSKTNQSDENKAFHLIQAFAPGEVSYEEAHRIGTELADKLLEGKYSYIVATHIDKGHVHNHIIFCAADNIEHKKYHDCKKSYYNIRHLSDDLCREHGLYVIPETNQKGKSYKEWLEDKKGTSSKSKLKTDINEVIKQANSYDEFISLMQSKGYEVENFDFNATGKYIKFRPHGAERFIRGSERTLGKDFTRERIRERIEQKPRERTYKMLRSAGMQKLIDTSSDEKYAQSLGLQKWADKQNLKVAARAYAALNEKGFQSMEELEEQISTLSHQSTSFRSDTVALEKQMREQALILKYAEQYAENRPYHMKYYKAKHKDAVFRMYESQLILYNAAKEMLKKAGLNPAKVNPDEVRAEHQSLVKDRNALSAKYKSSEAKLKELQQLRDTINQYMDTPEQAQTVQRQNHQDIL